MAEKKNSYQIHSKMYQRRVERLKLNRGLSMKEWFSRMRRKKKVDMDTRLTARFVANLMFIGRRRKK